MHVTAVLTPAPEGGYTAFNPETGTVSEGETLEGAVANLKEAVALYIGEFPLSVAGPSFVTTFALPEHA
jgi:predicted RNase H-like HicB family nuclease